MAIFWMGTVSQRILRRDIRRTAALVGWLVGLQGAYRGRAVECHAGRNRIGREASMELRLEEEPSVSRRDHAALTYEPRERRFYLEAGTSGGLTYLNGALLFGHQELRPYDRIALGQGEFLFLPLCGPRFSWDSLREGRP